MKKLSFLFVAFAVVGFITLSSCKSSTKPAEPATVVEEPAPAAQPADTAAAPTAEPAAEPAAE
jgi:hypothetical protein